MAKPYARKFYSSKRWRDCRNGYMASVHYICERCGGLAEICHHIEHITPENIHNDFITLNWDNLEACCRDCHAKEHNGGFVTQRGLTFDSNGNLIQVDTPHMQS